MRKAAWHDCLPSLLGDGDKIQMNWISVRWGKIFCVGPTTVELPKQDKNLLYRQDKPKGEPNMEDPLSFVLFESPFPSDLTVSRGHSSLASAPANLLPRTYTTPIFSVPILIWRFIYDTKSTAPRESPQECLWSPFLSSSFLSLKSSFLK